MEITDIEYITLFPESQPLPAPPLKLIGLSCKINGKEYGCADIYDPNKDNINSIKALLWMAMGRLLLKLQSEV